MERLRAAWEVRAGIIPGTPMPEYGKRWFYTNKEYEEDLLVPQDKPTRFSILMNEAHDYARSLTSPTLLNWTEISWVWY